MLGQELILFLNFLWMFSFGYFTWAWLYYPSINGIFFQIIHILYTEPLKKMISVSLILVCVSYKHAKCKYSPSLHDILWFKLKMVVFMISCSSNWKWMCVSMKNLLCIQHWQSKALVKKRDFGENTYSRTYYTPNNLMDQIMGCVVVALRFPPGANSGSI